MSKLGVFRASKNATPERPELFSQKSAEKTCFRSRERKHATKKSKILDGFINPDFTGAEDYENGELLRKFGHINASEGASESLTQEKNDMTKLKKASFQI